MQASPELEAALLSAEKWAQDPYFAPEDRQELKNILAQNNQQEILERFYRDLEFGTGGLRSIIGMGRNRMNKYNIRRATHALALSVKHFFAGAKTLKVAISYDSRHFSFDFAQEAASVMAGHGIHTYIFRRLNPTPLLSYSVRAHGAQAGIMITASHNPPNYNGYKVYWADGAQIIAPQDADIISRYNRIENFAEIPFMEMAQAEKAGLIHWVGEDLEKKYEADILTKSLARKLCAEKGEKLKIVYTPLHGTGLIPNTSVLKTLGFKKVWVVPEQSSYDGNFPTVKSPNPEDPQALKMAVDLMNKEKAHVVFGTDPDSDRIGVVVSHQGENHYLNGNQLAVVLLHYLFSQLKTQGLLPAKPYIVKTVVTSPLQDKIATSFGAHVENTLTGFKWICSRMRFFEEHRPDMGFVFASEESFGYLHHPFIRDKDAVSSVALTAEAALFYLEQHKTLVDALDDIYEKYGFHYESLLSLDYEGRAGGEKIKRIMDWFRGHQGAEIFGQKIAEIEDYELRLKKNFKTKREEKIEVPQSNVLGFILDNGDRVFLRPSGTEPKIKFYVMVSGNTGGLDEKKKNAKKKCREIEESIKKICQDL